MADNYIERQYEQYEARKAAWEKKRKQGKKKTISARLSLKGKERISLKVLKQLLTRDVFILYCSFVSNNRLLLINSKRQNCAKKK